MEYKVEVRTLKRTPVLFVRCEVTQDQIGEALGPAFGAVAAHAASKGAVMAGPPYARYYTPPPNMVMEAGMPVTQDVAGEGDVQSGELPTGEAAVTTHVGPFEEVQPAYQAIEAWMSANGRAPGGAPWEVYLTDPALEPDPAKWRTEIVWPLA